MIDDILTQDRRLVILRSLMDCNNEANESILQDCLDAWGITFRVMRCAP